ncbi:hypothetical protein, partial [Duncaniella sp.]|uniref:hypothetical protein n=1 Tax=Duncaniella sp. TaxID=2518496 RepID=UPI0023BC9634
MKLQGWYRLFRGNYSALGSAGSVFAGSALAGSGLAFSALALGALAGFSAFAGFSAAAVAGFS